MFICIYVYIYIDGRAAAAGPPCQGERIVIDNLLVQIHLIIEMIRWTGLAL